MELHNGSDEERFIEGQVLVEKESDIGGVYDLPEHIGFLGHLNTKLPEKNRKEQKGKKVTNFITMGRQKVSWPALIGQLLLDLNLSSLP